MMWIKYLPVSCKCGRNVYIVYPTLGVKKCVYCGKITPLNE